MPIRVTCPNCSKTFNTAEANAGKKARCGGCQAIVVIPTALMDGYELSPVESLADGKASGEQGGRGMARPVAQAPPPLPPLANGAADDTPVEDATSFVTSKYVPHRYGEAVPIEPWYYRYLVAYAWLVAGLGGAQFILMFVTTVVVWLARESNPRIDGVTIQLSMLMPLLASLVILLVALLVSAPIFLAVDAARNLRAIRYQVR